MVVLIFAVGAGAALLAGWGALLLGRRLGLIDRPDDDLKPHSGAPVPLGGFAVLVGAHVALGFVSHLDPALLAATLLVWLVGLYDDVRGLAPSVRIVGATLGGVALVTLADSPPTLLEGIAWVAVVVIVVNAMNLLDGLDALAGSVAGAALIGLAWFAGVQEVSDPGIVLAAAGALAGFLFWNLPPARLFLGDNGAYVVGVLLVWASMRAGVDQGSAFVAILLIGVPLLDLAITVVRRAVTRAPLFSGDRDHTYDHLHRRGMSVGWIAFWYTAAQAAWIGILVPVAGFTGDVRAALIGSVLAIAVVGLGSMLTVRIRT